MPTDPPDDDAATTLVPPSRPGGEDLAMLQATRFQLMIELGRGDTPMRAVDQAFQRAAMALIRTHSGAQLTTMVSEAVRAEIAKSPVQDEVA